MWKALAVQYCTKNLDWALLVLIPSEPISPLKRHPAESRRTSTGSLTSEGSSLGYRPVPKKRTFRSRRTSSQSDSNCLALDSPGGTAGNVPTPRRSLQRGSSENSNWSSIKGQDEIPQKSVFPVSNAAQPSEAGEENSQQPLCDVSRRYLDSGLKKERHPPSITRDRSVDHSSDPDILINSLLPS